MYTGTTPRSFNIDFMIIPRNQAEAEAIREAYLWLKKWSSGKQGNNQIMLEGPHVFTMNWAYCKSDGTYDDKTPLMHMLKTGSGSSNRNGKVVKTFFYIESVQGDFGNDGFMSLLHDGMPKKMRISISLRERKPMYQPDWYNDSFKPDANKKETK